MVDVPLSRSGRGAFEVAIDAASQAGEVLLSRFRRGREVRVKGRSNLVSDADFAAEKVTLDLLRAEYPGFPVLSEETNAAVAVSGYTWVVDPLDGTNNYVFGIPFFCVNVALVRDSEVVLGVTYDPINREYFHARLGEGACLNGAPVHVSPKTSLEDALPGYDIGYDAGCAEEILKVAERLRPRVHTMRVLGSASLGLAYVACGRMDLYFHRFLYPWDVASGILLVREAGGVVTDWAAREATYLTQGLVAANPALQGAFLDWAREGGKSP